jgi:hypothetical protein
MFVADCWNHRIVEFDQNMQFVKVFGSEGNGSGQFQRPAGIALLLWLIILIITYKSSVKMEIGSKLLENKHLVMVNLINHGMWLYVKLVAEYFLVIGTIVFKCSIQMANS